MPSDPEDHSVRLWLAHRPDASDSNYVLPFEVEQRVADDLAFLAAAEEGVKSVSAVALEQCGLTASLTIRLVANDTIPKSVPGIFRQLFDIMSRCATDRKFSRGICAEDLFDKVIILSQNRIHGRLQSAHWRPPQHRERETRRPLYLDLQEVSIRIEKLPIKSGKSSRILLQKLNSLGELFRCVDANTRISSELVALLKDIAKQCYAVSTSDGKLTLEETVANYGYVPRDVCKNKHIRQLYKLGRYWGLCVYLAAASRKYENIFRSITLECIRPYASIISPISSKGSPVECHVHAEIQLIVHYDSDINHSLPKPRVLGVSKAACYLCNLFVKTHADFFVSKTHGQLYDQWNVPNLANYSKSQRLRYRSMLKTMTMELQTALKREQSRHQSRKRQEALGSWLNLTTAFPLSPLASDAETVLSEVNGVAVHIPAASNSISPQPSSPSHLTLLSEDESAGLAPRNSPYKIQSKAAAHIPVYYHRNDSHSSSQISTMPSPSRHQSGSDVSQPRTLSAYEAAASRSTNCAQLMRGNPMLDESILSRRDIRHSDSISLIEPSPSTIFTPVLQDDTTVITASRNSTPQSWEFPIHRKITPTAPLQITIGKLSITVEIEEPACSTVVIRRMSLNGRPSRDGGMTVDVRGMGEGEVRDLEYGGDSEGLTLNLEYAENEGVEIALGWV